MSRPLTPRLLVLFVLALAVPLAEADEPKPAGPPPFDGLGKFSRKVTTENAGAQKYFTQGLILLYGFNHDEAIRSFSHAAALDPGCAMAHWGVAIANGPH